MIEKTGSFAQANLPQPVSGNAFNAANEMTSFNGTTLSYDANGNLAWDGTNTYTWDARNHLTAMSGGAIASFIYDANWMPHDGFCRVLPKACTLPAATVISSTRCGTGRRRSLIGRQHRLRKGRAIRMISGCCGSSKLNSREFVGGFDGPEIACGHRYPR